MAESQGAIATDERDRPRGEGVPRVGVFSRIARFYRQVVAELRKVIWPTRRELVTYTIVEIVFVAVEMIYVYVLDFVFTRGVLAVFGG